MGDTLMPGILLVNGIESDNEDLEFDCIGDGKTIKFKRDGVEVASIGDDGFVGAGGIVHHSVVLSNSNKTVSGTQTTLIDAGLSLTITPSSAKSTFLVMFSTNGHINVHTPNHGGAYAILKDGVIIDDASITEYEYATVGHHVGISVRTAKYVEHNSTAPVTFKLQCKAYTASGTQSSFYWHWSSGQISIGPRLEVVEFKDGGQ